MVYAKLPYSKCYGEMWIFLLEAVPYNYYIITLMSNYSQVLPRMEGNDIIQALFIFASINL
jgi:hypothetical protein